MAKYRSMTTFFATILSTFMILGGCATLDVTQPHQLKASTAKISAIVAIQAGEEMLQDAFKDQAESIINGASVKLFNKVILLPPEDDNQSPEGISAVYGADYIIKIQLDDLNMNGHLNPIWFASIPMFFFKSYAPIVTFETTATLTGVLFNGRTGAQIAQKKVSSTSTDHFSPRNRQDNVAKLRFRTINNATAILLEDFQAKLATP